jgi:Zn finger protein HypA/HybF involved in hydrogenase expression
MAEVKIYVEVYCPRCDSEDIHIYDYSEMTYFCYCRECKHSFEERRD